MSVGASRRAPRCVVLRGSGPRWLQAGELPENFGSRAAGSPATTEIVDTSRLTARKRSDSKPLATRWRTGSIGTERMKLAMQSLFYLESHRPLVCFCRGLLLD